MLDYEALYRSACIILVVMSVVMGTMLALNMRHGLPRKTPLTRFSALLYSVMFLFALTILVERHLFGRPGPVVHVLFRVACFTDYLLCGLFPYAGSGVLLFFVDPNKKYQRTRGFFHLLMILHIALLIVSQVTNLYYSIDELNVYHRAEGFVISLFAPALMFLTDVLVLLLCWKRMQKNDRNAFAVILAIILAAMVLHAFFLNVVPVAAMLCTLLMHIYFSEKQVEEAYRQQQENLRLRSEILLSQIQPHFLCNSLGSIAELCDTEPQKAKHTTLQISTYYRGILEALNSRDRIPFEQELAQTKLYLELVQLRYEDALRVEYQIGCTDFTLPPMSLQPLVENAVLHGIRRNPGGRGTLLLASIEGPDCYEILVRDDGPGFEAGRQPDRRRVHVGLSNVRERLRLVCGGSLEIVSEPGNGTTVTIRIPKNLEG